MENPIRLLGSRTVHSGNLVRLREDHVLLPRGSEAHYEYVEIKPGASVLALDTDDYVTLVREWKYAIDRPSLEVVSGGMEPDENPLETGKRELREEAGLEANEWIPLGWVDPFTTMLRCPNYIFLARGLRAVERELEEAESYMEVHRLPLTRAVELVTAGEITHGTSCVLILKAANWLRARATS